MPKDFFEDQAGRWWSETSIAKDFTDFQMVQTLFTLFSIRSVNLSGQKYFNLDDIHTAREIITRNKLFSNPLK